jgi:hypothetical protein
MKKFKRIGIEMLNILVDNSNGIKKKDLCVKQTFKKSHRHIKFIHFLI